MSEYLKILYQSWCKTHPTEDRTSQLDEFVRRAARTLFRTEEEIKNYCIKHDWFK